MKISELTVRKHYICLFCVVIEVCNVISGLLSKSRGQLLRLATVLHMLFSIDNTEQPLAEEMSDEAVKAAVNFIRIASQQTAYIAGRESLQEEFDKFKTGTCTWMLHPSCIIFN